jgi:hypothetical protein
MRNPPFVGRAHQIGLTVPTTRSERPPRMVGPANRPVLTHGRPYRGFGRFPTVGEHAKCVSESRRANAAYVGIRPGSPF